MNLLIEYFKSKNDARDKEYLFCIQQNLFNKFVEKVFVFISDESELVLTNDKLVIVKTQNRPTFRDLFEYANDHLREQICVIANTDIFLDETLSNLIDFNFTDVFISLTRWDVFNVENKWVMRYYNHPWKDHYLPDGTRSEEESITTGDLSQDAWIFKSPIKVDDRSNFLMGKPGCDNRISQVLHELGYDVRNPSQQIIIKHLHQTNYRTYTQNDTVLGPYLLIKPNNDLRVSSRKKTIPHF